MRDLEFLIGQTLDSKYRLEQKLGQGGMGAVFRATHLGTDRVVALKLIVPGLMDQQDFVARFQREARATGRLRHPNIVDMTDFGFTEANGEKLAYLVMEFLEGESLKDLLKNNPTPPLPFVVDVIQQVCSALQEAHDKGIVHRDLKPDNLWLEPNRRGGLTVKILDFGLAKIYDPKARAEGKPGLPVEDTETRSLKDVVMMTEALPPGFRPSQVPTGADPLMTEVGSLLGTPAYMSPEQCRGVAMDHRSDLYSLGVIAYQMLSGRTPFQGGSMDLVNQHIQSAVPPLAGLRKDLPEGVCALVMASMEKDPALRPQSAETLGEAFAAYCETPFTGLRVVMDVINQHGRSVFVPTLVSQSLALAAGAAFLAVQLIYALALHGRPPGFLLWALILVWLFCLFLGASLLGAATAPILFHGIVLPLKPIRIMALLKKSKPLILQYFWFGVRLISFFCSVFILIPLLDWGKALRDSAASHGGSLPIWIWLIGTRQGGCATTITPVHQRQLHQGVWGSAGPGVS